MNSIKKHRHKPQSGFCVLVEYLAKSKKICIVHILQEKKLFVNKINILVIKWKMGIYLAKFFIKAFHK